VGLLALVLLVLLRTDLISSWRKATPPDAPNRFVINVMPEQGDAFQQDAARGGRGRYDWYPMIRGRLVAINGKPVTPDDFTDDRAKRLVDREFNLSHAAVQPPHNEVVAGAGHRRGGRHQRGRGHCQNAEPEAGRHACALTWRREPNRRITFLRKVDWGSMRANFFVMYPVVSMDNVPVTYMSAFRAPDPRDRGFRQRAGAPVSQHHQRGHDSHALPRCSGCWTR
jgi:putative ABC transport system permease protein